MNENFQDKKTPQFNNDILTGHISRTVWNLSWPSATALLLQTISNNIDRYFVAQLGGEQVAALGLAQNFLMLIFAAVVAISAATTALVARSVGARDTESAETATQQSLYIALISSIFIMAFLYPIARPFLSIMAGDAGEIVVPGTGYFHISLLALPPLFMMTILMAAMRGSGDMLTPVKLTLVAAGLTAFLDWVLIFGNLGMPALGLNGAAWAAVISRLVACILGLFYLRGTLLESVIRHFRPFNTEWQQRILRLGVPAGLQTVLRSGASVVYFAFLGRLAHGSSAMAALTIGLGIEAIAYMPGFAYSMAAAAMVGQNLGSGSPDRARIAGWACARQSVLLMTIMAALFYIFAGEIASIFTSDAEIHRLTVSYLRINAYSEPFIALAMTLGGALQGAGDTRSPMISTFLTLWIIRLPLTYWLAVTLELGANAAWWTMSGSMIAHGIIITMIFAWGRWKDIKV